MSKAAPLEVDPRIDYYKALGVPVNASSDEIKRSFRALAKRFHPDVAIGDAAGNEARFKEVSAAYEVLGDPDRRRRYDAMRSGGFRGGGAGGSGFAGFAGGSDQVFDLNDLFGQFFTSKPGSAPPPKHSKEKVPPSPAPKTAKACDGSVLRVDGNNTASELRIPFHAAILGTVVDVATSQGSVQLKVPSGSSSGRRLRLRGKGIRPDGDHYVTVHIDVPTHLDDHGLRLLGELVANLEAQPEPKSQTDK